MNNNNSNEEKPKNENNNEENVDNSFNANQKVWMKQWQFINMLDLDFVSYWNVNAIKMPVICFSL